MEKVLFALWFASSLYGVPYEILYAVAKVESGLRPGAVNVNKNGSRDWGLMQINDFWVDRLGLDRRMLFNEHYNAQVGAYVLRYCIEQTKDIWKALECYHGGEARAKGYGDYARKVCRVIYGKARCG